MQIGVCSPTYYRVGSKWILSKGDKAFLMLGDILHENRNVPDMALLSVDSRKGVCYRQTPNRIELLFLFATLDQFGFGTAFCKIKKILYEVAKTLKVELFL